MTPDLESQLLSAARDVVFSLSHESAVCGPLPRCSNHLLFGGVAVVIMVVVLLRELVGRYRSGSRLATPNLLLPIGVVAGSSVFLAVVGTGLHARAGQIASLVASPGTSVELTDVGCPGLDSLCIVLRGRQGSAADSSSAGASGPARAGGRHGDAVWLSVAEAEDLYRLKARVLGISVDEALGRTPPDSARRSAPQPPDPEE